MQQFTTIKPGDFTVLLVEGDAIFRNNQGTIYEKGQLLFIESWMSTYHQLLLIYKGLDKKRSYLFVKLKRF